MAITQARTFRLFMVIVYLPTDNEDDDDDINNKNVIFQGELGARESVGQEPKVSISF